MGGGGAGMGGAIFNQGGSVSIADTTLALNAAVGGGGGNPGEGLGGALFNLGGGVTISSSTVTLAGSFTFAGQTGTNRFQFTGRLRSIRLRPGRYTLVATLMVDGIAGHGASAPFTIVG